MPETMAAVVWQGGETVVADVPRPEVRPGWSVLEVGYNGLCGTDLHITAGEHPRARPPLVIGHEVVGRVKASEDGWAPGTGVLVEPVLNCGQCVPCQTGRRHICDRLGVLGIDAPGGAAEEVAVPSDRLVALPEGMDLADAAFGEPLAVAVRAVRLGRLAVGESALVAGAGPVGLAVALVARAAGASRVLVSEPVERRRRLAEDLGFDVVDPDDPSIGADVVFDAAAHPSVAAKVTRWVATGSRVVVVGVYSAPAPVDLQAVLFRELEVIGTRMYTRSDLEAAVALLASGAVDARPLITKTVPLEQGPAMIGALRRGEEMKALLVGPAGKVGA